jgi:hypothetical protein
MKIQTTTDYADDMDKEATDPCPSVISVVPNVFSYKPDPMRLNHKDTKARSSRSSREPEVSFTENRVFPAFPLSPFPVFR